MNLKEQTVALEILTPAWATGANQQEAELRMPTIRGQLRFWLRMLFQNQGLDDLIFGRTDAQGAQASCVAVRLRSCQGQRKIQNLEDYTGKTGDDALQDPEAYFLWPLRPTRDSQQKRGVIHPPPTGPTASFAFVLTWLPPALGRRTVLDSSLQHALRAFSLLGSFGTRSTRGYGSVWPAGMNFASPGDLSRELDFLPSSVSVRLLPPGARTGRGALAEGAKWFRKLRLGTGRFGGTPSKWGRNDHDVSSHIGEHNVLYRPALGLPLAQNYRNGPRLQTKYRWRDPNTDHEMWNDRYPSPVRFKVVRIAGEYHAALVLLRSQLLPETTRLRIEERGHSLGEVGLSHDLFNELATHGEKLH